ncbi:MAG: glycosyltransferase family 4 protein [Sporocytophaga sp.]|uniref:glycosyltransferase family 4 protein n=1 Tax=Sporocytophaga sp. TaxID=2231183 RepID=UPI001B0F2962|nr:glycosyltransferase family 4 protein [Sporocytophaga sp.]MBO9699686.1 glycosyltransferase family 4 protein [Sporocytophaga sp.]
MKILLITHKFYPFIGGIEINSEILAFEFQKKGHEVIVVTWTEDRDSTKKFPFEVIRNPDFFNLLKLHIWADVVFENNPCIRLAWPALILRKKNVVAIRTWIRRIDGSKAWQDYLKLYWLRYANGIIAISNSVQKRSSNRAIVIGNPFRNGLFKDLGLKRSKDFVFIGRLVSDKGADLAIKALHSIIKENDSVEKTTLTIIGDGPEFGSLNSLVNQLEMKSNICFTGPLTGEALVKAINEHKFLLVPSLWEEPFGNVALEGMACGCIPIVSNGGGLPDAVGDAGLVFERGNLNDLIKTMKAVYSDEELGGKLKSNSVNHLRNHLPEVVAQKYLEVIESART